MNYKFFEDYIKERPYQNTKAFTKDEWEQHLYEIWTNLYNDLPIPPYTIKDYTIIFKNGNSIKIKASNYMDAKFKTIKSFNINVTEIDSVL